MSTEEYHCKSCEQSPCISSNLTFNEEEGVKIRNWYRSRNPRNLHKDDKSGFRVAYYSYVNIVLLQRQGQRQPTPDCVTTLLKNSCYGEDDANKYTGYKESPASRKRDRTSKEAKEEEEEVVVTKKSVAVAEKTSISLEKQTDGDAESPEK